MHDYRFAVSQERSNSDTPRNRKSQITIFDLPPWERRARHVRTLLIDNFRQVNNQGLESITWDPDNQEFIAGQEMNPMTGWRINPRTGSAIEVLQDADRNRELRDFAGMYYRPGDTGIYVLSEPTDTVFKLDLDGHRIPGQETEVPGRMPEGLTFTADGALIITVGEPNELLIKSSIGTCDWRPGMTNLYDYISDNRNNVGGDAESSSGALVGPPRTEGYCNWDDCNGGAQGTAFCRDSVDNCVDVCEGMWCSVHTGIPPITKDNYVGPSSPPPPFPPPPPPRPAWFADGNNDGEDGYCNWDGCNGEAQGNDWCRSGVAECVACMGTWCPRDTSSWARMEPVDMERYEELFQEHDLHKAAAQEPEQTEPSATPAATPEEAMDPIVAAALASQTHSEEVADEELQNGYLALMSLVLAGPSSGFSISEEEAILANAADTTFGSSDASALFRLDQPLRFTLPQRGLLQAEPIIPADVSEITGGKPASVIRLSMLGVTKEHAASLVRNLEAAIESGVFAAHLGESGLAELQSVAVLGSGVQQAPMAPQHFPMLDNPNEEQGDVIIVLLDGKSSSFAVDLLTGTVAALAGLLLLICVSAAVWCIKRRAAGKAAYSAADVSQASSVAGAQQLKDETVLQMTPTAARPPRPARISPTAKAAGPGHRRSPSDASSTCELLTALETAPTTPMGTPGHSRQTSMLSGDGTA